jgi:hypothetical protein
MFNLCQIVRLQKFKLNYFYFLVPLIQEAYEPGHNPFHVGNNARNWKQLAYRRLETAF